MTPFRPRSQVIKTLSAGRPRPLHEVGDSLSAGGSRLRLAARHRRHSTLRRGVFSFPSRAAAPSRCLRRAVVSGIALEIRREQVHEPETSTFWKPSRPRVARDCGCPGDPQVAVAKGRRTSIYRRNPASSRTAPLIIICVAVESDIRTRGKLAFNFDASMLAVHPYVLTSSTNRSFSKRSSVSTTLSAAAYFRSNCA